jgi:hypothetical protein
VSGFNMIRGFKHSAMKLALMISRLNSEDPSEQVPKHHSFRRKVHMLSFTCISVFHILFHM